MASLEVTQMCIHVIGGTFIFNDFCSSMDPSFWRSDFKGLLLPFDTELIQPARK